MLLAGERRARRKENPHQVKLSWWLKVESKLDTLYRTRVPSGDFCENMFYVWKKLLRFWIQHDLRMVRTVALIKLTLSLLALSSWSIYAIPYATLHASMGERIHSWKMAWQEGQNEVSTEQSLPPIRDTELKDILSAQLRYKYLTGMQSSKNIGKTACILRIWLSYAVIG